MPIDAIVLAIIVAIGAVSHFVWWDATQSKKSARRRNGEQATRNTTNR